MCIQQQFCFSFLSSPNSALHTLCLSSFVLHPTGKGDRPKCFYFSDVASFEYLDDVAKFLPADISDDSKHIRIVFDEAARDDNIPADGSIHLFTFFEDTHLYHFGNSAWLHYRMTIAMPTLYGVSAQGITENPVVERLSIASASTLAEQVLNELLAVESDLPDASIEQYAAQQTDLCGKRSLLLEEIAVLCAHSHAAVEYYCETNCLLIPFMYSVSASALFPLFRSYVVFSASLFVFSCCFLSKPRHRWSCCILTSPCFIHVTILCSLLWDDVLDALLYLL